MRETKGTVAHELTLQSGSNIKDNTKEKKLIV